MRRPGSTNIVALGTANPVVPDRFLEDFPCKEEKVEDFVVKLEEVVESKVTYFFTPSLKNSRVSDHDSTLAPEIVKWPADHYLNQEAWEI